MLTLFGQTKSNILLPRAAKLISAVRIGNADFGFSFTASQHPSMARTFAGRQMRCWDFATAIGVHAKAVKRGYAADPAVNSYLVMMFRSRHLDLGRKLLGEVRAYGFDLLTSNLMVAELMRTGECSAAMKMFDEMPDRDVVTWNSVVGGCVRNLKIAEAFKVFKDMMRSNVEPDGFTFASMMAACSRLGAISQAEWIHGLMVDKGIQLNAILSSALIDMYSKCGRIEVARGIFNIIHRNDVCVYNAMINGLAIHGLAEGAVELLLQMEVEHVSPDAITFMGLLKACGHGGLVDVGRGCFNLMIRKYSIQPQLEHYGAMVDLLGRAGLLEEAYRLIETMPMDPDVVIWRSVLSSSRTYKKAELGELAIAKISQLKSGDYVLLSNTYCSINKWESAARLREAMQKKRVHKVHGKSWIEAAGSVHQFRAGDQIHPDRDSIYKILEGLTQRVKLEGFVPSTELVLMDVSDEEKEKSLNFHSEKIALAFGILKSGPGAEIRISKNLRTCYDCHSWIKLVAKVLNRVIIIRDRLRFHRFEAGLCSCRDYW
uniref:DYW domain-containing protein n=1 Tax=Kalanchoe fedtschenkoi TaxID=63787 RepID=A0A7N0UIS8_KALFE